MLNPLQKCTRMKKRKGDVHVDEFLPRRTNRVQMNKDGRRDERVPLGG